MTGTGFQALKSTGGGLRFDAAVEMCCLNDVPDERIALNIPFIDLVFWFSSSPNSL